MSSSTLSSTASRSLTVSRSIFSFTDDELSSSDPSEETLLSDEESEASMERVVETVLNNQCLRPYQQTLLNKAIAGNIVAVLPTGTGKTLIAASLIKHFLHQTVGEYPQAKRTIFLAPTRVLVEQQYKYIKRCIPGATIERVHGDHSVDNVSKKEWVDYFKKYQILLFTPEILYTNLLKRAYISISNLNLIVFDEAHWAFSKKEKSNHSYCKLLEYYKVKKQNFSPEEHSPRIFGMTASLVNPKVLFEEIPETVKKFEKLFMADVASDDTSDYIKEAVVSIKLSENSKYREKLKRNPIEGEDAPDFKDAFTKTLEVLESCKGYDLAKNLKRAIIKVQNLILTQERRFEHMGPWFAIEALKLFKGSINKVETHQNGSLINDLFSHIQDHIEQLYRPAELTTGASFALHGPTSDKLTILLKTLTDQKDSLNCIVFVNERIDANLIYRWLLIISESYPEYAFIKPGFICGSVAKNFIRFDKNTTDFKEKFENGQLNVMIATAVLEEGIDVPICNVVIRYNFPENFRAYTQSKGRARDRNSNFYLLIDPVLEKTRNWTDLLIAYKQTEDYLKSLRGNSGPSLSNVSARSDNEDEHERLQTAEGADLYEKDAIVYLREYMQRLPADFFTERKLNFSIVKRAEDELSQSESRQNKFCAVFIMPINSSLTGGFVCGHYRSSIARAKDSCAFKVCKLLLERGEMDGHLKIITKDFLLGKHIAELNLKVDVNCTKGEKSKNLPNDLSYERVTSKYSQAVRASLLSTLPNTLSPTSASLPVTRYHLYTIEFLRIPNIEALFSGPSSSASVLANTAFSSLKMGILCERKLPSNQIDSIIYLNGNQLHVRIVHKQTPYYYPPDSAFLSKLHYYTNHLQQHVLVHSSRSRYPRKVKRKMVQTDERTNSSLMDALAPQMTNFFLVPVNHRANSDQIDYKLIEDLYDWQKGMDDLYQGINTPTKMSTAASTISRSAQQLASDFPEKAIFACYHQPKLKLHYVKAINKTIPTDVFLKKQVPTAFSELGNPIKKQKIEMAFDDYYHQLYGVNLVAKEEPMIHAAHLESTINALHKFGITFKVAKMDKELRRKRAAEKGAKKKKISNVDEESEAVNLEDPKEERHYLLFPSELARRYPLPYYYFIMLNAYPYVLYRLETFLIATEFIKQRAEGHLPPSANFSITNDEKLPESLLTADSYSNQQENNSVVGKDAVVEAMNDDEKAEDEDSKDYQLMDIEQIEASKEVVMVTSAQARQFARSIASIIQPRPKTTSNNGSHQKEAGYFDRLLAKLKAIFAELANSSESEQNSTLSTFNKLPRWRTLADSCERLEYGETSLFAYRGDIDSHVDISFNTFHYVAFPNPWYIVKALTLKKAADIFNLEQLETVGDAFLKMSTAMYLYFKYLNYDEGKLTQLKTALVCNENLYHLAVEAKLPEYANGQPLAVGQNWLMPFLVPSPQQRLLAGERYNKEQTLKYKQVADLVESLIGACLVYGSAGSALVFFNSIGLKVFDPTAFKEDVDPVRYYQQEMDKNFRALEAQFGDAADRQLFEQYRIDLSKMVDNSYQHGKLKQVETAIGYTFKHKYFLVQAFTHPSYSDVDSTTQTVNYISSFQRLEFIGDAILDYLITYFVYQKNPKLLPEAITNLRTSLVNNDFYSSVVIKHNLHTALRCSSAHLKASIAQFVKKYKCAKYEQLGALINDAHLTEELLKAEGSALQHSADDVKVPKALADIFEALVGAIYIDNGFDLDALWKVVYRLIKVEVDYFSKNIPENPLSWLEKHYVKRYKFEELINHSEAEKSIELKVRNAKGKKEDIYEGYGSTIKMCKVSAVRFFMRDLKKKALKEAVFQSDGSTSISVSTSLNDSSNSFSKKRKNKRKNQ